MQNEQHAILLEYRLDDTRIVNKHGIPWAFRMASINGAVVDLVAFKL